MLISFYSSLKYHHSSAIQRKLNFQLAGQDKLLCIAVYTSTCLERDLPVLISTHRLSFLPVLLKRGKLEKKECCGTYLAAHQLLNHQHKRTKTTLEAGLTTSQRRIVWFKTHMPPNNTAATPFSNNTWGGGKRQTGNWRNQPECYGTTWLHYFQHCSDTRGSNQALLSSWFLSHRELSEQSAQCQLHSAKGNFHNIQKQGGTNSWCWRYKLKELRVLT